MTPPPPRVSVLLPYRDAERTLEDALRSVLAQTVGELELVAIDDGSRDTSAAIVARLARLDGRLVPVRAADGAGIATALCAGLAVARAPLVARADADDLSRPERLARQLACLAEHPDTDVVATQVEPFADPGAELGGGILRYCAWQNALLTPEDHARERFVESPICHPTVLIPRATLERAGAWREGPFPEDYDLWLRLLAAGARLRKVAAPLYRWRVHAGQATWRSPRYTEEAIRTLKAAFLARELAARGRPVVLWGAGPTGRRLARALAREGVALRRFVDIDPRKIGRMRQGVEVVPPLALSPGADTIVVAVGAAGARPRVREWLLPRGFRETEDFLFAA